MATAISDSHIISILGKVYSALGMATQQTVYVCVATFLLSRRDTKALSLVIGICGNGIVAKILKRIINESRPQESYLNDPGMPSGHTMSLFFIATSFVLLLANPQYQPMYWPVLRSVNAFHMRVVIVAYAIAMSIWRVQQGIHSKPQVEVGALLGITNALCYHFFISFHVAQVIKSVIGSDKIPRCLLLGVCVIVMLGMTL